MRNAIYFSIYLLLSLPILSNPMNVAASPTPPCTPAANSMCEWIESIDLANLFNSSGNDGGYGNYLSLSANLQLGDTYPITLIPGTNSDNPFCTSGSGIFGEYWQIWIDLNQNGTLDDVAELVYDSGAPISGEINDIIQIPTTAISGNTLMRISMNWAIASYPCNMFGYGEFEDYTVNLIDPCDTDTEPPTAICKDHFVFIDASGNALILPDDVNDGSMDNCSIAGISVAPDVFDCTLIGDNAVVLTVSDDNGNTASCSATVTVEDNIPPTAICQDITVQLDTSGVASISEIDVDAGSDDNCLPLGWGVFPNTFNSAGTYTVTLEVNDMNGNTASCDATVTVTEPCSNTANLSYTLDGQVGDFTISLTPPADSIEVYWDFGDGTVYLTNVPNITHVFPEPGEDYAVTAFVTGFYDGTACLNTLEETISIQPCPEITLTITDSTFTENEICYDVFLEGASGVIYDVDVQTNNGYGNPTANVSTAQNGDTITVCLDEYFPPGTQLELSVKDPSAPPGPSYKAFLTSPCSSRSETFKPPYGIITASITEIDMDDDDGIYVGCEGRYLLKGPSSDISTCSLKQKYYYITDKTGIITHKCAVPSDENSCLFTDITTGSYKIYYVEICGQKDSKAKHEDINDLLGKQGVHYTEKTLSIYNKLKCNDYYACCGFLDENIGFKPENMTEAEIASAMNHPQIAWSTGDTTFNIAAPMPGTYYVTITAPEGDSLTHEITVHPSPTMEVWGHAFPTGDSLGVTVAGGVTPYQYAWSNGGISRIVHGIPPTDSLYVTVTDALGCSQTAGPISLSDPCSLSPTFDYVPANTVENCNVAGLPYCVHSISIMGGAPPYNFDWQTTGYVRHNYVISETGTTINILYNQSAEWSLSVTDANDCGNFGNEPLIFSNLPDVCGAAQNVALNIYDHSISPVSSAGNDGAISVTVEGGVQPYFFEWASTVPGWLPPPLSPANLSVDGGINNGYELSGLASGWYIVTVTDNVGDTELGVYWIPLEHTGSTSGGFTRNKKKVESGKVLLKAYSNPMRESGVILFGLLTSGNCELVLYNTLGSKVATLFEGYAEANQIQNLNLNAKDLTPGTYFCTLTNENGMKMSIKLLVLP